MATPTFALVHGMAHGAWCWERTIADLAEAGHRAVALDLPLDGLEADATAAAEFVNAIDGPVVLVGHSYGGLVISRAAPRCANVERLVYVAALLVPADVSFMDFGANYSMPKAAGSMEMTDDGALVVPEPAAIEAFYHRCDPADAAWAANQLRPTPAESLGTPPGAEPWRDLRSTYVRCLDDQAVPADAQEAMAEFATERVDIDTDHSPFLSARPELVAALLQ